MPAEDVEMLRRVVNALGRGTLERLTRQVGRGERVDELRRRLLGSSRDLSALLNQLTGDEMRAAMRAMFADKPDAKDR